MRYCGDCRHYSKAYSTDWSRVEAKCRFIVDSKVGIECPTPDSGAKPRRVVRVKYAGLPGNSEGECKYYLSKRKKYKGGRPDCDDRETT